MRRVLLIAALFAFGTAGVAYGATVVTNVYVITAKVTPKKSGTIAHPKPEGTTIAWTAHTTPSGQRPNVVKQLVVTIAGIRGNTNAFPTCSTSRLNNSKQGPSTCPKGSLVGTGFFIVTVGPHSSQAAKPITTCRAELSIYNGGGNSLSYYTYVSKTSHGSTPECPATTQPLAFAVHVKEVGTNLVQTINIPFSLRHFQNNTALDDATLQATANVPVHTRKVKGKTVGFGESIACPVNHKRHISIKFTLENGKSQTATANVPCT